ncbi:MAG: lipopolysaccharide heptosyltransferase II [Candidatus Omnitrophica bacterium]|nr:lipopolysaccharide heptosyltransferase II [Candidatus Omnitrophota bacterium]
MKTGRNKRILIFNVNWLGDVLFSTAAIRNIRRNFPESFIACVIPSRCYPILKGNPYLDEVIIFDEKDRHRGIMAKLDFIRLLKAKRFDTVFIFHRSFTRALICRLAGIPERVGYYTRKRAFLLTKNIIPPPKYSMHRIDYYLTLVERAGLKVEDRYTDFVFSAEDERFVRDFLGRQGVNNEDFLIVINPGGNWLPKRWPKEHWIELTERLIDETAARIVISGSHTDLSLAAYIKEKVGGRPIIACGVFNIKQFGALAKIADLLITADTGPLHIANSVGAKKIIAIFGPTSPEITGPYPVTNTIILKKDVACKIPCYATNCRDSRCMKAVTPEEVFREIEHIKMQCKK